MSIAPTIDRRRAYRALDSRPIPAEVLERLARAGHQAPSFMNNQPWRFITITDAAVLSALRATLTPGNYWGLNAPAITAVVTRAEWDGQLPDGRQFAWFDTGMAAMAYQLQAVHEGLTVHPIAGFDEPSARAALKLPEGVVLLTLLILGYPGDQGHLNDKHRELEAGPRTRKPLEQVFAWNSWDPTLAPPTKA